MHHHRIKPWLGALALLAVSTGSSGLTPPPDLRVYPTMNFSGWYDPYFGTKGQQVSDIGRISIAAEPELSDEIRFLHRRPDGSVLAVGRSQECGTNWNQDGVFDDGCREVLSLALYDRDGRLVPTAGRPFARGLLTGYTDTSGPPDLSGMQYFPAFGLQTSDELLNLGSVFDNPQQLPPANDTAPYRSLPQSFHPSDSTMAPSGKVYVLGELLFRGPGCTRYEQTQDQLPCLVDRAPTVLAFDARLNPDFALRDASLRVLRLRSEPASVSIWSGQWDAACLVTHYTALAVDATRIYVAGFRRNTCTGSKQPAYQPFVVALTLAGRLDIGFASHGLWEPVWHDGLASGGAISDLQIDAKGDLLVLAGVANGSAMTTALLKISPAGQPYTGFAANGMLRLPELRYAEGERHMLLALAPRNRAYVFASLSGQLIHVADTSAGVRDSDYGPGGVGVYDAGSDLLPSPAFQGRALPYFDDLAPLCGNGVALVGTSPDRGGQPTAVVLNGRGVRAPGFHDDFLAAPAGLVFDNYLGRLPNIRRAQGFAALYDASDNKLLVGGSAGQKSPWQSGVVVAHDDFALSARRVRCVDVD